MLEGFGCKKEEGYRNDVEKKERNSEKRRNRDDD